MTACRVRVASLHYEHVTLIPAFVAEVVGFPQYVETAELNFTGEVAGNS